MKLIKTIVTLVYLTSTSLAFAHGYFEGANQPTEVMAAHESFLRGDFAKLPSDIKRALQAFPSDADIQNDMLKLYDKSYELKGHSALTPDFKAPLGVRYLGFNFRKRFNQNKDSIVYRINVSGELMAGAEFEQIKVVAPKGNVLIDSLNGLGEIESEVAHGHTWFWTMSNIQPTPFDEGLYLLTIKMKNEPVMNGYIIASQINASESPEFVTPQMNETLTSSTPTFRWHNFVSSQYRNFEKRKTSLSVVQALPNANQDTWSWGTPDANITHITVGTGEPESETGVKELPNDNYTIQIRSREYHQFGDIRIGRESATNRNFSVKK